MTAPASSQGASVYFNGVTIPRVVSIRAARSCQRIDFTGLASSPGTRIVRVGELEPIVVTVTAYGPPIAGAGASGPLSVSLGGAGYGFSNAFVESVDVGAGTGELIKSTYSFVASD